MLEVIDILQDSKWKSIFLDKIKEIQHDSHHNKHNYTDLEQRLDQYDCFNIVVDNGVLNAFSGLYSGGIYPPGTVRALDRTYYFNWKNVRSDIYPERQYATLYMWPYQVARAKELGYKAVFFSIQNPKKRRIFTRQAGRKNPSPTVLPTLHNTCRLVNGQVNKEPLCWQNVAVYKIDKSFDFTLPAMAIEDYKEKYKDIKTIR